MWTMMKRTKRRQERVLLFSQACSVKMTGYWPNYFIFFFACLCSSRSINSQKQNEANIQPS